MIPAEHLRQDAFNSVNTLPEISIPRLYFGFLLFMKVRQLLLLSRDTCSLLLTSNSFCFPNCLHLLAVLHTGRLRARSLSCRERAHETPSSAHLRRLITDNFSRPDNQPVRPQPRCERR